MKKLWISLISIVVISCNSNKNPIFNEQLGKDERHKKPSPSLPSNIKAIFSTKCTPCHTSKGGTLPNWLDYSTVVMKKEAILSRAIDITDPSRAMPPSGMPGLSDEQKKILRDWFLAGSPADQSGQPTEPPLSPDPTDPPPTTPPPPPPSENPTDPIPGETPITFNELILPRIINKRCTLCHNANSDQQLMPNWSVYANAFNRKERILERVVIKKDMPPVGMPMTQDERDLIRLWIEAGAPESVDSSPNPPPVAPVPPTTPEPAPPAPNPPSPPLPAPLPGEPSPVNYQQHIKPRVFSVYCSACHNESSQLSNPKTKNWLDYSTAFANIELIRQRVFNETDPAKRMPLGATLPYDELHLLKTWIESGAPEW